MPRKTAYLRIKVIVESDDVNIDMDNVVSELDYNIESMTDGAKIVYTEIVDRESDD